MGTLSDVSRDIADLVARLGPSVVRVDARRGRPATGIIWADNLVLTADHVLEQEEAIQVTGSTTTVKASIAGRDPGTDLALLRTDGLSGVPAPRGRSTDIRAGHIVIAVGQPGEMQVTVGIVSGLSGSFRSWRGGPAPRLIHSTPDPLSRFSGGALFDSAALVSAIDCVHLAR